MLDTAPQYSCLGRQAFGARSIAVLSKPKGLKHYLYSSLIVPCYACTIKEPKILVRVVSLLFSAIAG